MPVHEGIGQDALLKLGRHEAMPMNACTKTLQMLLLVQRTRAFSRSRRYRRGSSPLAKAEYAWACGPPSCAQKRDGRRSLTVVE